MLLNNKSKRKVSISVLLGAIMLISICLSSALLSPPESASTDVRSAGGEFDGILVDRADRTIKIGENGLVTIQDDLSITNTGSQSVGAIYYCLSSELEDNLVFIESEDQKRGFHSVNLLQQSLNSYRVVKIDLTTPLLGYDTLNLSVVSIYRDLPDPQITQEPGGQSMNITYSLDMTLFPIIPYEISVANTLLRTPPQSGIKETSPQGIEVAQNKRQFEITNLESFFDEPVSIQYAYTENSILRFVSVDRTISINNWGYARVTEEHTVENPGYVVMSNLVFTVPETITEVNATDHLGVVKGVTVSTAINPDGTRNVTFDLTRNRARLQPGDSFSYKLHYDLPFDEVHSNSLTKQACLLDLLVLRSDFIIDEISVRVQIESASSITNMNLEADAIEYDRGKITLIFSDSNVVSQRSLFLSVEYTNDLFVFYFRPLILILLFFAIGLLYVVLRPLLSEERDLEKESDLPLRELREYIRLYDTRISIIAQLDELKQKSKASKIDGRKYKLDLKEANNRLKKNQDQLSGFKEIVIKADSRLREIVEDLDYQETERDTNIASLELLRDRHKSGKIPAATYRKLKATLEKKIESNRLRMLRNLGQLKAFLV